MVESGVKHHKPNQTIYFDKYLYFFTLLLY